MAASRPCLLGVDIGGTNTDCAVLRGGAYACSAKAVTTKDVLEGMVNAVSLALGKADVGPSEIDACMVGTTHFVNALVQRKQLGKVLVLRLCGDSTAALPPFIQLPRNMREALCGEYRLLQGTTEGLVTLMRVKPVGHHHSLQAHGHAET